MTKLSNSVTTTPRCPKTPTEYKMQSAEEHVKRKLNNQNTNQTPILYERRRLELCNLIPKIQQRRPDAPMQDPDMSETHADALDVALLG